MLFRQSRNRLRRFWDFVKFHVKSADYTASYQGNPDGTDLSDGADR